MQKLITFIVLSLMLISHKAYTQESSAMELLTVSLPPLERLFEGARNSSTVEFYNYRMEGEELTLKTERRKWQEYINFFGTYQYGIMGMNSYTDIGADYPIVFQNSAASQLWYNAGVSVRIPLDQLFDRRNRIRRQQLRIKETLKERDLWYDEQKIRIVELYARAQEMLNNLKHVYDLVIETESYYNTAQRDYIVGAITAQQLSVARGQLSQSRVQLENVKSELTIALYKLEILSNYKILN